MNEQQVFICECGSYCHQTIFWYDKEDKQLHFTTHLITYRNLFKRLWVALRYIFGYKSNYGEWDNFLFKPIDEARLLAYLKNTAIYSNGILPAVFVVIQCGYEGIEGLIYASAEGSDASAKVKSLRADILKARERMEKIIAEHGNERDKDLSTYYDRMFYKGEIDEEEHHNANYRNPDAYCVQKWDGKKFSCVCKELDCEPDKVWLM